MECLAALKMLGHPATSKEISIASKNSLANTSYYMKRLFQKGEVERATQANGKPYPYIYNVNGA
jgi:hypothetical protein